MVDTSTLLYLQNNNGYVCTYGYFTLQRSRPRRTVDTLRSAEQKSADNMKYDGYTDGAEGQYGGYFTEVTLTWEPGARKQNCTYYVFHTSE